MNTIVEYTRAIIYVLLIAVPLTLGAMTAAVFVNTEDWIYALLSLLFFALVASMHLSE